MSAAPVPVPQVRDGGAGAPLARHVAIIMDGNGRWAKKRFMPRAFGHKRGVEAVRAAVRAAGDLGLEALTLYAFSSENWKRPADEISDLMGLLRAFIRSDIDEIDRNGVRLKIIGEYRALAPDLVQLIDDAVARTAGNTRLTLAAPPPALPPRARSRPRPSRPSWIPQTCRRSIC